MDSLKQPKPVDNLHPGSLYIVISMPLRYRNGFYQSHEYKDRLSTGTSLHDYEWYVAQGLKSEEFFWELYFHKEEDWGDFYRLQRYATKPNRYRRLKSRTQNLRHDRRLVCMVRILHAEGPYVQHVDDFLDWWTYLFQHEVRRTYIFAMGTYRALRYYLQQIFGASSCDLTILPCLEAGLTAEILSVAYPNAHTMDEIRPEGRPLYDSMFGMVVRLVGDCVPPKKQFQRCLDKIERPDEQLLHAPHAMGAFLWDINHLEPHASVWGADYIDGSRAAGQCRSL